MNDLKKFLVEQTRVLDEAGRELCQCRDQATAERIADALSHLYSYEAEHEPLTKEGWENLGRMLDDSDRQYRAEHPDLDQNVTSWIKFFRS